MDLFYRYFNKIKHDTLIKDNKTTLKHNFDSKKNFTNLKSSPDSLDDTGVDFFGVFLFCFLSSYKLNSII